MANLASLDGAVGFLRRQLHYGGNDGGSSHGDGYVTWRVGHTVNIPKVIVSNNEKMADIVLMWIYLFSLYRLGGGCANRRNQLRRTMFVLRRQRCLRRSRESLSRLFFMPLLLALPPFQDIICSLRAPQRFWAAPREHGFWEKMFARCGEGWDENIQIGRRANIYIFACPKIPSGIYLRCMASTWRKKPLTNHSRQALPQAKRLAIVLHWLAQASSCAQIAALYAIRKSTVVAVVQQGIDVLRLKLVPEAIRFSTGSELEQVMVDFEALCGLPCCGGALDGTFMPIKKPAEYGHTYFCYKRFNAIIVLGCVDARGIFTYVNSGQPGSVGDSYTFWHSALYQVTSGEWLAHSSQTIEGVQVNPFLAADAVFPLAATCMKCYEGSGLPPQKHSFNYS